MRGLYDTVLDRESAEEILTARRGEADAAAAEAKLAEARAKHAAAAQKAAEKEAGAPIEVTGMARLLLGEGIEKEESDFAAEVAATAGLTK